MIKMLMHIPNRHDATSYYRACPMMSLSKSYINDLHLEFAQEISFAVAMKYDVAFFQRPSTASELEAIRIFKRLGIPVIVDFDDLLFDIPTDNPAYQAYMNKQTQENIVSILKAADLVWVSTNELKRCFQLPKQSLNEKVFTINNALDDMHLVFGQKSEPQQVRQPAVLWRGSQTHERDLMEYTPEIDACAKDTKYSFVFAGYHPWFLTEGMRQKQAIVSGNLPVGEFMDFIYATGASIGMVPLFNSRFNKCKSNIAWLEMTWGGAAVLAPEWEEWAKPGVTTFKSREDFKIGLSSLLNSDKNRLKELNNQSWEHIKKNYLVSITNKIRAETIKGLLGMASMPVGGDRIHDEDIAMELQ